MPDITIPNTLSDGNTILASELNQNFTAVTDVVNGNIDNDNIAAGAAIAASKLAIASILTTASTVTVGVGTTGDANPRIALDSDGHLVLGSGSAAGDVRIKRESAGVAAIRNAADSAYEDLKVDGLTAAGTVSCATITPTNAINETVGGTGQTSWTTGDIPYASASNTLSKLGIGSDDQALKVVSGVPAWVTPPATDNTICQVRLSLTSSDPWGATSVSAGGTIYAIGVYGAVYATWDGSASTINQLSSESTLDVSAYSAGNYRIYIEADGTLTATAWSNDTTPPSDTLIGDGYYVNSSDNTKRALADILVHATGDVDWNTSRRGICHIDERLRSDTHLFCGETANTYSIAGSTSWRGTSGGSTLGENKVVLIASDSRVFMQAISSLDDTEPTNAQSVYSGIGIDSTSSNSAQIVNSTWGTNRAVYHGYLSTGKHTITHLERNEDAGTITIIGDNGSPANTQSGMLVKARL